MRLRIFKTPRILFWIFPRRTWGFSRKNNTVYLTFDDGPQSEITEWVMDLLKVNNIKATFFCVGNNLKKHPEIVKRLKLEGHVIGNHSMNHEKGTQTQFLHYKKSIDETSLLLENRLFRPPYGRLSSVKSFRLAKSYQLIMWSWLSYDFDPNVPIEKILYKARKQIKPGDIIVLHDNMKTFDRLKIILPEIISIIRAKKIAFGVLNFDK
ncbi:MAG: polysaccharide deacetylase family protein [Flavobacteriia bacterium]|nr:polysaccharide deacetylase family protein [Flavobacteriia bacterium]